MIYLKNAKRFCKEYYLIENYQEAVNDTTQTWHCHHRYEIEYNLSKIELQAMGFYFDRPFCELIFLTPKKHKRLHKKGRIVDEETRQKISDTQKCKPKSEEIKEKISNSLKGNQNKLKYQITEEELYDLYVVQNLTLKQIAELYGSHLSCIHHKLKKFDIKK